MMLKKKEQILFEHPMVIKNRRISVGFILTSIFIFLFIILCKKLSGFFFRTASHLEDKDQYKKYHEAVIRDALQDIREALLPEKEMPEDHTSNLINANKEITQKKETQRAIREELDIEI